MLNPTDSVIPPPAPPSRLRSDMLRYMERWGRWIRKLPENDLAMVVSFAMSVEQAWQAGQTQVSADAAAAVEAGQGLPGLGGVPMPEEHYSGVTGDPVRPQVSDLVGDDNASN